ncbi:MAG: phosphate ABC transporter permease PstA [Oligoflexia bacterium]|nr:phosphate ABC transporter permease PstA [Oligoflexia bacterium]MBF0364938.1 phosphate ABC transporter permease PstA [Oligoflexia bacterium]
MLARKIKNQLFLLFVSTIMLLTCIPLLLIIKHILTMGASAFSLELILNTPKAVGELGGGIAHAIAGSLLIVALASLYAVPIGIIAGVFLSEFRNSKLTFPLRTALDTLAGTPSIVIGIFAYVILVVPLKSFSGLAGSVALSLIIIPIVVKSTEEILKLIPITLREAGLALGFSRTKVIWHILIKCHRQALLTGVMLALARTMGETAPLLFTAFGNSNFTLNLRGPMASLPVQIFNYASSPHKDWQEQAWSGALVLIILVFLLSLSAKLVISVKLKK